MIQEQQEETPEYVLLANEFKQRGNEAFKEGNIEDAINFFSQAIDLDPDNHVFYSNRSACYMKSDSISKALKDSEKCKFVCFTEVIMTSLGTILINIYNVHIFE